MQVNSPLWIIARKEAGERMRNGWVLAGVVVWLGAICLTSAFGLVQVGRIGFQGYDRTVVSLLNLVQYLVPLLGLLLGHDAVVGEREGRTLPLVLAAGAARRQFALGKLLGAALALSFPLVAGFALSAFLIMAGAGGRDFFSFVRLAGTSLALGLVFVAVGWWLSAVCASRVKALVIALLVWGFTVFAFDLAALGLFVAVESPSVAAEIEMLCDPMHVAATASDLHAVYEDPPIAEDRPAPGGPVRWSWLWLNPVDLFRAVNLSGLAGREFSPVAALAGWVGWCVCLVALGLRSMSRLDC